MTDLGDLFDRATDGIASPSLAVVALETARRRRTRRRGAVAAVLASGVVVTVVVATQLGGGTSAGPAPSTSTPTSLPADPAPVDEQPEWDPRTVDDLPASDPSVAPALPETIDPPGTAPDLADSPVAAAVLAVELEGTVMLLGTDGSWRSLVVAAPHPRVVLSPSGTRVAVYHYADTGAGVTIRDLATGAVAQWPYPEGYQPWDFTSWSFTDDDTLLLDDGAGGFLVDVTSGSAERVPYPATAETSSALDDAGAVLESSALGAPPTLTDWADGTARTVPTDETGPLRSIAADSSTVVGLTQLQRLGVVVADRRTLAPRTLLPVRNPEDNYGKGGLGVVALADDGTVLLRVSVYGRRAYEGFRVVSWDPGTGDLSLVSSAAVPIEASVVFADALVSQ